MTIKVSGEEIVLDKDGILIDGVRIDGTTISPNIKVDTTRGRDGETHAVTVTFYTKTVRTDTLPAGTRISHSISEG